MSAVLDQDGAGHQNQHRGWPAQCSGTLCQTVQRAADGRYIMDAELGRQQMRQDETGDRGSGCQTGNRIQAELRQTRKAGQQQRSKSEYRRQHAQAHGRPEAFDPVLLV